MKIHRLTLLLVLGTALPAQDAVREATCYPGVSGSLLLCGGGELPHEVTDLFFRLAGGAEARIVVVPTASTRADGAPRPSFATAPRPGTRRRPGGDRYTVVTPPDSGSRQSA